MDLVKEAAALFPYTQANRRTLHKNPELAFKEFKTASLVASELGKLGLEVETGFGVTGVAANIEGAHPGPTIALRFDMDALPIQELNKVEYGSTIDGCMHACGHDGHVAIGLSVAKLLEAHKKELHGTVRLVFQPGEEGAGGADAFIADGGMGETLPEAIFGLHVWNEQPVGWLGIASGPVMAASSTFTLEINGKGGHGAIPHLSADPVLAMANVISAAQSIISRNLNPVHAGVLSFCSIHAGSAANVIPSNAVVTGTIRSYLPEVTDQIIERLTSLAEHVSLGLGSTAALHVQKNTPPVINDAKATKFVLEAASALYPDHKLDQNGYITMGAEDFASYLEKIPGCFYFIGSANAEKGLNYGHHHPRFDFDESALVSGVAIMTQTALQYGSNSK